MLRESFQEFKAPPLQKSSGSLPFPTRPRPPNLFLQINKHTVFLSTFKTNCCFSICYFCHFKIKLVLRACVLSHFIRVLLFRYPVDCSPPGSSVHGDSPGKYTGVGGHALFQGILPTQRLNLGLSHLQVDSLPSEPTGKTKTGPIGSHIF